MARQHLREAGIRACFFLQFGFPAKRGGNRKTIDMVGTKPDDIGVSLSYPLPNTRFHERVREQLGAKRNWSDSDDLSSCSRAHTRRVLSAHSRRPAPRSQRLVPGGRISKFEVRSLWQVTEPGALSRNSDATFSRRYGNLR